VGCGDSALTGWVCRWGLPGASVGRYYKLRTNLKRKLRLSPLTTIQLWLFWLVTDCRLGVIDVVLVGIALCLCDFGFR